MSFNFSLQDLDTLSKTIYGEARGELYAYGLAPFIAVANVVVNRKNKNFAETIHGVCTAPYQFSCWNRNDPNCNKITNITVDKCAIFRKCIDVANNVLRGLWPDLTDGCDHYHHKCLKPQWAVYLQPKRIFGSHYFYEINKIPKRETNET
ncbi:MAG: cell wall hydrolase [Holosporaceae bacterium]|jgi:spore germination cell wall hydrolase CwlJ-like protein|nr:cell wall hydrolase [Holosporaceae bacterium]